MASDRPVRVAIVGLGFGAEFIPIYQQHPHAEMYAICRRREKELHECGDRWKIKTRYTDFNKLLARQDAKHALAAQGLETDPVSSAQFAALIQSDIGKARQTIKSAGIVIQQ